MAAAVNQTGVSASSEEICLVVNRWLVDHYVDLAIKAFKDNEYDTFCTLRDVLDGEFSECFRLVVSLFFVLQQLFAAAYNSSVFTLFEYFIIGQKCRRQQQTTRDIWAKRIITKQKSLVDLL